MNTLSTGTPFGPYEILGAIGAGGMGEVYRAHDTKLKRDVALKVLPAAFNEDREHLARFEREAQLLAQLHHPNIASIFGLEESQGVRALVMELVEGPTLAERLERGALSLDECLAIGRQIAEALEEAHEKGIVHRDLKPQNIKASLGGKVKVLDFGLAKAMDSMASATASASQMAQSPTLTLGATATGMILGTPAYMAPEQARGLAVDKRADIWAFGVVLYEMLCGRSLFVGATVSDQLADVLKGDIDLSALPPIVPAGVRDLLRRCLERDPHLRLRDIGEARIALGRPLTADDLASDHPAGVASRSGRVDAPARRALPWALALALVATLAWIALSSRGPISRATPGRTSVLAIPLPPAFQLPFDDRAVYGQTTILAIAPDGSRVVFVGGLGEEARLYARLLSNAEVVPIEGTEGGSSPFFSPDGRWVGFFDRGKLHKVPVEGGKPIALADASLDRGAVWCPDGSIVFSPNIASGLVRLLPDGGAPLPLTELDAGRGERTHRWPAALPGGREVAFTIGLADQPDDYENAAIDAVELATGKRRPLLRGASMVRFAASGHVLLGREGQVLALPLAAATGGSTEEARPVLRNVAGVAASGIVHFDVAADGTLVYAERDPRGAEHSLAWLSRVGELENLPLPPREYRGPMISPDGRRIAVGVGPGSARTGDVWVHELASGSMTRLTFDGKSFSPAWSRDGRGVTYTTLGPDGSETFAERLADGSAEPRLLFSFERGLARAPIAWMTDGSLLSWEDGGAGNLVYAAPGAANAQAFARTPAIEVHASVSPDGRYVAYAHNDSGNGEIYVQPFPPTGAKWQVTSDGGVPRFSRDGHELFFLEGRKLMSVQISTSGTFSSGAARELLEVPPSVSLSAGAYTNYDVAPDGRFLVVRSTSDAFSARHLTVILNWFDELKRTVPVADPP